MNAFEDVAGFLNAANGSGAGAATQLQEDLVTQAKSIYCCCPPPPELPSLSVADSEDGSARCISRALVISTAPSRAIPAPLVALWSSDKCSSPLPPDHLDRERAALRTDLGGRLQIWAAAHLVETDRRFFDQIGRKLTAMLLRCGHGFVDRSSVKRCSCSKLPLDFQEYD